MKKILQKVSLKILFASVLLTVSSCDSLLTALDSTNQSMGGVCLETICSAGYYNSNTDKYVMDAYLVKNENGEEIEYDERRWVDARANDALDNGIGINYYTSPYSDESYKFVVTCSQWQQ